jgi:hypothetical protein
LQEEKEKEARRLQQQKRTPQQELDTRFFDRMSIGV